VCARGSIQGPLKGNSSLFVQLVGRDVEVLNHRSRPKMLRAKAIRPLGKRPLWHIRASSTDFSTGLAIHEGAVYVWGQFRWDPPLRATCVPGKVPERGRLKGSGQEGLASLAMKGRGTYNKESGAFNARIPPIPGKGAFGRKVSLRRGCNNAVHAWILPSLVCRGGKSLSKTGRM